MTYGRLQTGDAKPEAVITSQLPRNAISTRRRKDAPFDLVVSIQLTPVSSL